MFAASYVGVMLIEFYLPVFELRIFEDESEPISVNPRLIVDLENDPVECGRHSGSFHCDGHRLTQVSFASKGMKRTRGLCEGCS